MWLLRGTVLGLGGDFGASRSGCHFTAITPPVAARWQGGPEEAAMQPGPLLSRAARHCSSVRCRRLSGTGARSSTDRASDYGSEGWGFESLRARPGQRLFPTIVPVVMAHGAAAKCSSA